MKHKSILFRALLVFAALLAFDLGAHAQKSDCSQKTEKDVVIAVYEKMKVKYANQIRNVNLRFSDGVLTIEGWVPTKAIRRDIGNLARKTDCVVRVDNRLKLGKSGGCGAGLKECGGICISEKESCNVCLVDPAAPGCYATPEQKKP